MLRRLIVFCIFLLTLLAPWTIPLRAQATDSSRTPLTVAQLPRPHLGYGIHVAPHAGGIGTVDALQMDWVKVYEPYQVGQYSATKKVLYRMDFGWPDNWDQFKVDVRARTMEVVSQGVTAIEVHNEPNLTLEWSRGPDAWEYTQMLRVVYTEIKAVAPQIIVVSGGLAPAPDFPGRAANDLDFARVMFESGAGAFFDVFGYHPYGFNAPPEQEPSRDVFNFRRVELIRAIMNQNNLAEKPIWLTEFGWLRNPAEDGVPCSVADPNFREFVWMQLDSQTQSDYIVRAFDFADRNWPWVGPMFLWNLNWSMLPSENMSVCNHMRWFSLLTMKGEPTMAYYRVAAMPRRPARPAPEMSLVADAMTVETGVNCPGVVRVGEFEIQNTGYPGEFTVTIAPARSFLGPRVEVSPQFAEVGDIVQIFADTSGLTAGRYIIYINVLADIGGRKVSQNVQGYVIVSDTYSACME